MPYERLIKQGDRIAEIFPGEYLDITRILSELTGPDGRVYYIDKVTGIYQDEGIKDFKNKPHMANVEFIESEIPPIPVGDLDHITFREMDYIFANHEGNDGTPCREYPELYASIDESLKPGGHLIIVSAHYNRNRHLSKVDDDLTKEVVEALVDKYLGFKKIIDEFGILAFKKDLYSKI